LLFVISGTWSVLNQQIDDVYRKEELERTNEQWEHNDLENEIIERESHLCRVAGNTVWSHMVSDFP